MRECMRACVRACVCGGGVGVSVVKICTHICV